MKSFRFARIGLMVCGFTAMNAAVSHHSYAMFDRCTFVTIEGRVSEIHWVNPHIVFNVELENEEPFRVEWFALNSLARRDVNVTTDDLKAGDSVVVTGMVAKDPEVRIMTMLTGVHVPTTGWSWGQLREDGERPASPNCAD